MKRLILGMMGAALLYACSTNQQEENKENAVKVEVYSPMQVNNEGFYLSGMVTAEQTAAISTRLMGRINKIYVKPGDQVSAGQLLVSISNDDVLARKAQVEALINEAEAAAQNTQRDYERFKALHAKKSVSDKELENITLQNTSMKVKVEMARQQLREVNNTLNYTNIKAPFEGIITQKMMDEGSMANPGIPILSMEQNSKLQIVASIPESYIQHIQLGDSAKIELKSLGMTIDGRISEISPSAAHTGGQYAMKISFYVKDHAHIHSGMYANIHIPYKRGADVPSRILLEEASIVHRDQLTGVYVVNDKQQAILRWVRLGKTMDNQFFALSGLNANEKIIRKAEGKLYNGKDVILLD